MRLLSQGVGDGTLLWRDWEAGNSLIRRGSFGNLHLENKKRVPSNHCGGVIVPRVSGEASQCWGAGACPQETVVPALGFSGPEGASCCLGPGGRQQFSRETWEEFPNDTPHVI